MLVVLLLLPTGLVGAAHSSDSGAGRPVGQSITGTASVHAEGPGATPTTKAIKVDQAEIPDSFDPAVTFSTPGWGAVQQVYQGLVQYNGSSSTSFSGVLASNWTVSLDPLTGFDSYTFTLRSGAHFSNGDPYNAYVQWYSLYRSLLLEQGAQFILEQNFYSTNFSASSPLSYYSTSANDSIANATLVTDLSTWNFATPTAPEKAEMAEPAQSFQVLSPSMIRLNVGYGYLDSNYTYLLASIAAPIASAVDPAWIEANGGVQEATINPYAASNSLGTGPYVLGDFSGVGGGGYVLTPDPSYWGATDAATEPWNLDLRAANTSIDVIFQSTPDVTTNDLLTGAVQEATFPSLGPSTISALEGHSQLTVQPLPPIYGGTVGSWWIYLDQTEYPFNNLSVREAIAHAINYTQIVEQAFGGDASQWVGPVPPGFPYDNNVTAREPYYQYDLALAYQEMADSPCAAGACRSLTFNYMFLNTGAEWSATAALLKLDLGAINLTINPVGVSLDQLYEEQGTTYYGQCVSATNANGGPFYMGQEFYTSDYLAPDDWTQNDAVSTGSANYCMAQYDNATVDSLVYRALADPNPTGLTADYSAITQALYSNYSEIWLVVPTSFAIYATDVHGIGLYPMGSAQPASLQFNTQWLASPTTYPVTFSETGLSGGTWYVNLTGGASYSSTGGSLAFTEPNGTYAFTVGTSNKEYRSPGGSFSVSGAPWNETVAFALVTFDVTFSETGLSSGTNWSVTVNLREMSSTTPSITFAEPNGTYTFSLTPPPGTTAAVHAGTVVVNGTAVGETIAFTSTTGSPQFLGLPNGEGYALVGLLLVAAVVVIAIVIARRRARPPASPSAV
jgi:ABC-type transport system substrate-binding protein